MAMNEHMPQWEIDSQMVCSKQRTSGAQINTDSFSDSLSLWDNEEVAELTWENGQLAMHGLGPPKSASFCTKLVGKHPWDVPDQANGTLECIVHQGTGVPDKAAAELPNHSPWFLDALVPCSAPQALTAACLCSDRFSTGLELAPAGSCPDHSSCHDDHFGKEDLSQNKCQRFAIVPEAIGVSANLNVNTVHELGSQHRELVRSISGVASVTIGINDPHTNVQRSELGGRTGGLSMSAARSPGNTSTAKDDQGSVCHSRTKMEEESENRKSKGQKGRSNSTRRSRAAAVHNQSERKRRDRINQKMKTLQKLIPNSSKTDKASILDEVIEYLKQLQATVQLMSQTSMQHMMMPMNMQQLQMCMLAQMSMNSGIQPPSLSEIATTFNPATFLPPSLIDKSKERVAAASLPYTLSTMFASQAQAMNVDPFKVAALYQQLYHPFSNVNGRSEE